MQVPSPAALHVPEVRCPRHFCCYFTQQTEDSCTFSLLRSYKKPWVEQIQRFLSLLSATQIRQRTQRFVQDTLVTFPHLPIPGTHFSSLRSYLTRPLQWRRPIPCQTFWASVDVSPTTSPCWMKATPTRLSMNPETRLPKSQTTSAASLSKAMKWLPTAKSRSYSPSLQPTT